MSGTLWALAKLRYFHSALLDSLQAHAAAALLQFGPREVANLAWAVASLSIPHPTLAMLATRVPALVWQGQNLASILWSFAEVQYFNKAVLDFLVRQVATAEPLGPVEIANIMWAVAALRYLDMPLVEIMSSACAQAMG